MAQSLANILIHVIFSTKKRQPLILPEIMQELYSYMAGIARTYDSYVHEIGGIEDHIHILVGFSIGLSANENLRRYIQNQKNHHKKISFQDEHRAFLKNYCIV